MIRFCSRLVLLTFFVVPVVAQAQRAPSTSPIPLQIHGQVRYATGGKPAELILVRLESFRGGVEGEVTTDRSGKFNFSGLSPDLYVVAVRTSGFREASQQVDLRTQLSDYVQLALVSDENGASPAKRAGVIDSKVPHTAVTEFEKGRDALFQKNDAVGGIRHLENAIRNYPAYLEALLLLGTAYMDREQWDNAEKALKRTLEINPKTVNAYLAMGEVYARQKKYAEAETALSNGLLIEYRSWQGHFALARIYYIKGDLSRAARQVGLTILLNDSFPDAHFLAAQIHLRVKNREDALEQLKEYLRLAPKGEFATQARLVMQKLQQPH